MMMTMCVGLTLIGLSLQGVDASRRHLNFHSLASRAKAATTASPSNTNSQVARNANSTGMARGGAAGSDVPKKEVLLTLEARSSKTAPTSAQGTKEVLKPALTTPLKLSAKEAKSDTFSSKEVAKPSLTTPPKEVSAKEAKADSNIAKAPKKLDLKGQAQHPSEKDKPLIKKKTEEHEKVALVDLVDRFKEEETQEEKKEEAHEEYIAQKDLHFVIVGIIFVTATLVSYCQQRENNRRKELDRLLADGALDLPGHSAETFAKPMSDGFGLSAFPVDGPSIKELPSMHDSLLNPATWVPSQNGSSTGWIGTAAY